MSFKVKEFYEKAFSEDYCGKMPKWLVKVSGQEFRIMQEMIQNNKIEGNVVDFGCGDGRVIKWLKILTELRIMNFKYFFGIDIINKPKNFPTYASYIQDNSIIPLQNLDRPKELIDLVISVGVSVHLDVLEFNMILSHILLNIKPGGYVIWQLNHKRTLKGMWLNWTSGIEYKYHNFEKRIDRVNIFTNSSIGSQHTFKLINKQSTKISDIFLLRKI